MLSLSCDQEFWFQSCRLKCSGCIFQRYSVADSIRIVEIDLNFRLGINYLEIFIGFELLIVKRILHDNNLFLQPILLQ